MVSQRLARVRFGPKHYGCWIAEIRGRLSQIYLRETEGGWVVESEAGGGLGVPRLSQAITIADHWLLATGGRGIVVKRSDGTIEEYGESSDMGPGSVGAGER